MHVLGARFATLEAAGSALRDIRATVDVPAADVGVRPLGTTRYDAPVNEYLLAGRFADDVIDAAATAVERHGGVLFTLRSEAPRESRQAETVAPETRAPVAAVIRAGLTSPEEARERFGFRSPRLRDHRAERATAMRRPAAMRSRAAREHRLGR
jgi:hypothetical protein